MSSESSSSLQALSRASIDQAIHFLAEAAIGFLKLSDQLGELL